MPIPSKGFSTYLALGPATSETDISTYVKQSSAPIAPAKEDTTTHGNGGFASSTTTIQSGTVPFSGIWNPTLDAILQPLRAVEGKSCIWGPAGNSTGKPKISGLGYLSKFDRKADAKGIVTFDAEFTFSGTITEGVF